MERSLVLVGPEMVLLRKSEAFEHYCLDKRPVCSNEPNWILPKLLLPPRCVQSFRSPNPNYLSLSTMLILPSDPVHPHHLSIQYCSPQVAGHAGLNHNIGIKIPVLTWVYKGPSTLVETWPPVWLRNALRHLKQFNFMTQCDAGRERTVSQLVAKILHKFTHELHNHVLWLYVHIVRGKKSNQTNLN